jgi:hypothetical protein
MSDLEQYAQYFPVGSKVGVGIPLSNSKEFSDWAVIHNVDEDLMSLQLSRDVLPAGVTLEYGQILEVRGGSKGNSYCCRAIIVSEGEEGVLFLRLIGEIVSDELREFYRIDAFLPIRYYISGEQNIDRLREQWEERRLIRQRSKINRNDSGWDGGASLHDVSTLPREMIHDADASGAVRLLMQGDEAPASWDDIIPLAANISGGGMRLITHQGFASGEYVLLELLVPFPRRLVDVVARIAFANRKLVAGDDREYFSTGLQFKYIDEPDRDAIVNYISTIQQKRILQMRESYLFRGSPLGGEKSPAAQESGGLRVAVLLVILLLLIVAAVDYFWKYSQEHPKGEIEKIFEKEIKKRIEMNK